MWTIRVHSNGAIAELPHFEGTAAELLLMLTAMPVEEQNLIVAIIKMPE